MMRRMLGRGMRGRGSGSQPSRSSDFGRAPGSEESSSSQETGGTDIGILSMEGEHEWKPLLHITNTVTDLQISPDRRWMAYSSFNEDRSRSIYVRLFSDVEGGGQWQVTTDGDGNGFLWSQDGRDLFYSSGGLLKAVEVETEPTFKLVKSEILFRPEDIGFGLAATSQSYDVDPDGKRFLMLKEAATADDESQAEEFTFEAPRKINIVLNWFEEIKEKVPVD